MLCLGAKQQHAVLGCQTSPSCSRRASLASGRFEGSTHVREQVLIPDTKGRQHRTLHKQSCRQNGIQAKT
eukprot:123873-Chlamydomonas_euryale.AAC.4